jgi:hypothetical protein
MPFARAIQCLEAKHVTAADIYVYWLAIVAQLSDLMSRDGKTNKYATAVKEKVRAIVNFRFAQLINNPWAKNIYLSAFALDPRTYYYLCKS